MKRAFFDLEASQIPLEPEFAEVLRKNQRSLYVRDDSPFTLPNGTQVDPREPSAQAGQEER